MDLEFEKGECYRLPPNFMYPERGESSEAAKAICEACVIKEPCLEYALANKENKGIWGGTSGRERRAILLGRRASSSV